MLNAKGEYSNADCELQIAPQLGSSARVASFPGIARVQPPAAAGFIALAA
jgi:hypothetical protein